MIGAHPTPDSAAPAPARAVVDRQLAVLTRLAEIGMEIAEAAGRQATGVPPADSADGAPDGAPQPAPMRDPALVYVRVARAVRLTIALQSRLMADLAALDRGEALAAAEARCARRARLQRLVQRAVEIEQDGADPEADGGEILLLAYEARERLAEADLDAELEGAPFAEVVARICRDLGLSPERTARILAAAGPEDGPPGGSRAGAGSRASPKRTGERGSGSGARVPEPPEPLAARGRGRSLQAREGGCGGPWPACKAPGAEIVGGGSPPHLTRCERPC